MITIKDICNIEEYEKMPWSLHGGSHFTKPPYMDIEKLSKVPYGNRSQNYGEFYELTEYLKIVGSIKSKGKLLDAGAGCGSLSFLFSKLGWKVTAFDWDKNAFQFNQGIFFQGNLNQLLPFNENEFDCITCKQTIEHLENPNHLAREFSRILKPGGIVIISTPNTISIKSRVQFLLKGYPAFFSDEYWNEHRTIIHFRQLANMLEGNGFDQFRYNTNRYEWFNFSSAANGKRMKFIAPLSRLFIRDNFPDSMRYGQFLILSSIKKNIEIEPSMLQLEV